MDRFALERYQERFGAGKTPDPALKGVRDGNCNRTACQAPGATGWHTGTQAWYCPECTREINRANNRDAMNMYGIPKLIVVPSRVTPEELAQWKSKGIYIPKA